MSLRSPTIFAKLGIRARLALLFVGVFGVFFTAFNFAVFGYIARTHQRHFDAALYNYVIDMSHLLEMDSRDGAIDGPWQSEMLLPFSMGETLVQVSDSQGHVIRQSKNLKSAHLPPPQNLAAFRTKAAFEDIQLRFISPQFPDGRYRMVSHLVPGGPMGAFTVQAALPTTLLDRQREALITFFVISVPLIVILAGAFGWAFSARAMAPVAQIIARTREIQAKHLSEGIPVPQSRDEIRELAVTFNGLLGRLDKAFQTQEGFVADASHQLKTPLSILKGELEVFCKGSRTPDEVTAFIESARQEIDYLVKMVEDLLMLARLDAVGGKPPLTLLRFDEKLLDCVSRFERSSKARDIRFSVHFDDKIDSPQAFAMNGEPELLRSLIDNLLDNAVKYSPDQSVVDVSLSDAGAYLKLCVEDCGAGVPNQVLTKVFERFYRSESNRDNLSGSGLGLSIVKRIAQMHEGNVVVYNRERGGASFQVILPKDSAEIKAF